MNVFNKQCFKMFGKAINVQNNLLAIGRLASYKSAFSLDNIYPTSNMKLHTPNFVPEDPDNKFSGYIPMDKLTITSCRSSGPGGQHVNKVNTKVDVRFHLKEATWLDDTVKQKLSEQYPKQINKEGYFVIKSELTSSQQLNIADALSKLRNLIRQVLIEPKEMTEETKELIRKRQIHANQRRLYEKRAKSQARQDRRGPDF